VRITSGFGGGEFTKTLRKVCTYQKLKFSFLLFEYCKIRECYAVANAFTIRNIAAPLMRLKMSNIISLLVLAWNQKGKYYMIPLKKVALILNI
jgi:hypothetical protein